MPITERKGIFAVYVPEVVPGSPPLPPIHILAPTPMQKNCILVVGIIWPTVASCLGITSGVLHNRGDLDGAKFWFLVQYSTWTAVLFSLSMCFYYYGFKYMFILRANIIIAEEALKTPRSSFGIGLLASKSPARFLLATLHFTGIGGGSVTFSAGLMAVIWLVMKDYILSRSDERWVHIMSFIWTTGMAPAYSIIFVLTHLLSVRSRRRGVHDHTQPNRISSELQRKPRKSAGKEESDKDLEAGTINDVPDQCSVMSSDLSSTTKWSSDGNHKAGELLARTPEPYRLCSSSANRVVESEPDGHSLKIVSLNPPPRPVKSSFGPTSIPSLNAANPSVLHEFVFGGETRGAHHRASSSNSGLPVSLFSLHAVPFASRRYQSRPLPSLRQQFPPTKQNDDGSGPFDATTSDGEIGRSGRDQPLTKLTNEDATRAHCTHRQAQEVDKETEAVDLATVEQVVIEMDDVQRQIEMHQQDSEAWLAVPIVYK
ncbi:MAG: hypothetical protein BYD32DRAFT_404602 [Podila humilis]|nr:MAG: hypothetical protein BYD32DRAFT_404602 [Podila humilis]